ncbi:Na+/glutamate symporter-like protein [uncultured spirochete]|jgi:ESS family glutamate:Na+ symporter|uniref:Na+/glutamate symporter-like protein n=1 Tax=uncultured spirochete TaxID=156406 RepID=A0A3P3XG67_9SPIR|nr:Na+/glutamate symporter-like protein [uncultured spirochete]HBE47158.1 sodium:glutamate symporter [Spirochaetaceae bacterium]HCX96556.1 sodium:glutamate symporter [Spirochaetaceae bacterium]
MDFSWKFVIDAGLISIALVFATFLRSKITFLQKYLVPNALTAGFLLLPIYNYLLPSIGYATNRLGDLVYHLLNISFISMSLRSSPPKIKGSRSNGGVLGMSAVILFGYASQAILGLLLTLFFLPKIHPAFGLHLPLGFALGPGQAYAIGKGWESMGFEGGASVGLTFAAIGYLWACFGGMLLIHKGIRKGWMKSDQLTAMSDKAMLTGIIPREAEKPIGAQLTTDSEAIDSFSYHAALVVFVYFLSFLFLKGLTLVLGFAGKAGMELATNLWGINFIFSAIIAIIVRKIIDALKLGYVLDDNSLTRISGMAVDYMVAGALAAISLVFVGKYWFPIVLMSTLCGFMVYYTLPWVCSRIFRDFRFERMLMLYGVSTGTLSTGLALLRVMDPEFKTKVSSDYMLSAGLTFVLALPFILAINLPAKAYTSGSMTPFWIFIAIAAAYLVFVAVVYWILARKRRFAMPSDNFYRPGK